MASLFEETYITKPKTSRPLNSEIYLVGKRFKGISNELAKALLDRCEAYKTLDKWPTTWGSLLQPAVLAKVDADILLAAQGVHGEQQVTFLNEIVEAFRIKNFENVYETSAQEAWLKENPVLAISKDENLNNTQISAEEQAQAAQQTQAAQQASQAQQIQVQQAPMAPLIATKPLTVITTPELEEESILVPEENEGEEGEGAEGEEGEGESSSEDKEGGKKSNRKIITFKL